MIGILAFFGNIRIFFWKSLPLNWKYIIKYAKIYNILPLCTHECYGKKLRSMFNFSQNLLFNTAVYKDR